MYAVVEASGKQYQVVSGRFFEVDRVAAEPNQPFVFEKVLMIVQGEASVIGRPYIDGAKVVGQVVSHVKGKKCLVYKYRPKKGTRKRQGHRQKLTRIYVESIQLNDKVLSESKQELKSKNQELKANANLQQGKASLRKESSAKTKNAKPQARTKALTEPKEVKGKTKESNHGT